MAKQVANEKKKSWIKKRYEIREKGDRQATEQKGSAFTFESTYHK